MDDEADREAHEFFGGIALRIRRGVIRGLLAGNDTRCFTTEQYRVAYFKAWPPPPGLPENYAADVAPVRMHLETSGLVEEAGPDVWKAKEL